MTDSGIKILRRNRIYQVLDRMEDYPISVIIAVGLWEDYGCDGLFPSGEEKVCMDYHDCSDQDL